MSPKGGHDADIIECTEATLISSRVFFLFLFAFVCNSLTAAQYATANFIILDAPSREMAADFGNAAEQYRHELSLLWLGKKLPNWSKKCPIRVKVSPKLDAGGATSFVFQSGHVYDWEMDIQGSKERILDCVLPHEITHMIFASHFRRPLPRWLDEGAATFVEVESERANYRKMLLGFLRNDVQRGIPFSKMFSMSEYPSDVLPLYAQGFSVTEMLIHIGGHQRFIAFANYGLERGNWSAAVQEFYMFENLGDLQVSWLRWVENGFAAPIAERQIAEAEILVPVTRSVSRESSAHSAAKPELRNVLLEWKKVY